jgi:hypothetical protein
VWRARFAGHAESTAAGSREPRGLTGQRSHTVRTSDSLPELVHGDLHPDIRARALSNPSALDAEAGELVEELDAGNCRVWRIPGLVRSGAAPDALKNATTAPVGAMETALSCAGVGKNDVELYEINEAFAVVTAAERRSRCWSSGRSSIARVQPGSAVSDGTAPGRPLGAWSQGYGFSNKNRELSPCGLRQQLACWSSL